MLGGINILSIFLVDDEKGIVEGLKIIIERGISSCKVVGCAYTAAEGITKILELKPDIVITDICMPQTDGLEMIKALKNEGCNAKFIILSGYSEFEYAQKGIALGVKFYINKPVEEDELFDCLNSVFTDIRDEKALARKIDSVKNVKDFVLRDILDSGCENINDIEYMLDSIDFPVSNTHFQCAIVDLVSEYPADLVNSITQFLYPYKNSDIVRYTALQIAIIVSDIKKIDPLCLFYALSNMKSFLQTQNVKSAIGIGNVYTNFNGISKSFEEARQALNYKVIKGMHSIITYNEIKQISENRTVLSEELITKLENHIENMDIQGCETIIENLFKEMCLNGSLSLSDLQIQSLNILLSGMRKMSPVQLQLNEFLGKNILALENISRFETLDQLKNWLTNTIKSIIELKGVRNVPKKKDVIDEVKEYIIENYDKNISLAELSSRFFINPYYLSQLFKEKTGETYLNFVIKTRINKAKGLLQYTDMKVYEICESIGYSDTNYFSKLFEKIVGCRPSEYKKKIESYQKS